MNSAAGDRAFAGSIPELYERHLVPLIFEPPARDLAQRVAAARPSRVLEVAAGTGVVTRRLAAALPAAVDIVATDLNPPMIELAARIGTPRPVTWQQADAARLPFADGSFDAVVCQFGAMFFPDKGVAFAEARRVLRPGGHFFFSVWDAIEHNEFADCVTQAVAGLFPADPPRFLARLPHGYHDRPTIAEDLRRGGFERPASFDTVTERSRAASPRLVAIAYCQGTPLRNEIEARDPSRLDAATDTAAEALARRFGRAQVDGHIQALVLTASKNR